MNDWKAECNNFKNSLGSNVKESRWVENTDGQGGSDGFGVPQLSISLNGKLTPEQQETAERLNITTNRAKGRCVPSTLDTDASYESGLGGLGVFGGFTIGIVGWNYAFYLAITKIMIVDCSFCQSAPGPLFAGLVFMTVFWQVVLFLTGLGPAFVLGTAISIVIAHAMIF